MENVQSFEDIVEMVENLSPDDQDALFTLIKRRRAEARRREIAENVKQSREELAAGVACSGTVDDLMEEFGR